MHCELPPALTTAGSQVTRTAVIVEGGGCTVMEALPVSEVSCVLVAVMVTVAAAGGAVKSPLVLILPELADHVTSLL